MCTGMLKFGKPPYLECSSRGNILFSAFWASPSSLNGRSIEEAYQGMKRFKDGSTGLTWREAKGRRAINQAECELAYAGWWIEWVEQHGLLSMLKSASGLSDVFGQKGHICQAEVLWEIRNSM